MPLATLEPRPHDCYRPFLGDSFHYHVNGSSPPEEEQPLYVHYGDREGDINGWANTLYNDLQTSFSSRVIVVNIVDDWPTSQWGPGAPPMAMATELMLTLETIMMPRQRRNAIAPRDAWSGDLIVGQQTNPSQPPNLMVIVRTLPQQAYARQYAERVVSLQTTVRGRRGVVQVGRNFVQLRHLHLTILPAEGERPWTPHTVTRAFKVLCGGMIRRFGHGIGIWIKPGREVPLHNDPVPVAVEQWQLRECSPFSLSFGAGPYTQDLRISLPSYHPAFPTWVGHVRLPETLWNEVLWRGEILRDRLFAPLQFVVFHQGSETRVAQTLQVIP